MTAAKVLERTARTVPGAPDCSAMLPVFLEPCAPPALLRCPEPPVARFEGRCPCGHVRGGWFCAEHVKVIAKSGCRACLEDEGGPHECPLTVTPVTVRGDIRG